MKKLLILILILFATLAYSLDLDSYCRGFCSNRYQDGMEKNGKCACIDYYPLNLLNRIEGLKRPRRPVFGPVFD